MAGDGLARVLSVVERKALMARGHGLSPRLMIGKRGLTDAIVAQVRQALGKTDLLKVRVDVERGAEADAIGRRLAEETPCHLVRRVGKILLLYRPLPEANAESSPSS
jgi:RNA-binding protein